MPWFPLVMRLGTLVLLMVATLSLSAPAALATHNNGVFELDGNALVNTPPRDDWNTLFAGPGTSIDHVFLDDHALPDPTIFKGGDKDRGNGGVSERHRRERGGRPQQR